MKELYIIRHAKSSWSSPSLKDFDRPLNDRGLFAAPEMGRRLVSKSIIPDCMISSPANRAISTAKLIANEYLNTIEIIEESKLYHASISFLLGVVNEISKDQNKVFIVGHNPGVTDFAEYLSNQHFGNLPTAAVVGIRFEFDDWSLISGSTGDVIFYDFPKNQH